MSTYAAQPKADVAQSRSYERNNYFGDHSPGDLFLEP